MDRQGPDRREFLTTSASVLGGGWLAARLPLLAAISACAREAEEAGSAFVTLTEAEANSLRAFADQIFPPSDTPGASDANVVRFVDHALDGLFANLRQPVVDGLADLDGRARDLGATDFAALDSDQQIEVMRAVENTPFFGNARLLVVGGMFSHPSHGGNEAQAGFRLLQMEQAPAFQPPFGYYDGEVAGGTGGA